MKKLVSFLLALCLLASLAACGGEAPAATTGTASTTTATAEATVPAPTASAEAKAALDGKKIIFIGNSFTQSAHCVIDQGYSRLSQADRVNDQGYFYQVCKNAGLDVNVTAWCFGGHDVSDTFAEVCPSNKECAGQSHPSYLTDRYYDYVAIQLYRESAYTGDLVSYLKPVTDLFREANPNVKFLLLVPHMAIEWKCAWVPEIESMAEEGFIIVNWGAMLHDIVTKQVTVPGATQPFSRPTFVISKSAEDGYHQNILAGYITALMTYCAITGDSAVGHPWEFCYDNTVFSRFQDLDTYKANRYVYEPYTNFDEVFKSKTDMHGLQALVDQYLLKYNGGN